MTTFFILSTQRYKKICIFAKNFVTLCAFLENDAILMEHSKQFVPHISKELVNLMPLAQFDGETIVIDQPDQVAEAVTYLCNASVLGVDTEARPSFTRGIHYPTALVQIATEERCYLFRLNKIGFPPALAKIFSNKQICKVGLAFKDDLNGLRRLHDFKPQNCVDLQSLGAEYGILDLGLQKIFAIVFGKKISKSQQLTNWEADALTPEQARYAATDAWATLLIYNALRESKPLPRREVERLKFAEKEAQVQHQLDINMHKDIDRAIEVLQNGGVILYPTDTVWGIGCDATNDEAVNKLFQLKQRDKGKSVLVLVDSVERIAGLGIAIPEAALGLLEVSKPEEGTMPKPITIIYPAARGVSEVILAEDGSLGIRVTYEKFSHLLCEQFGKPIVSTSANFSGRPTPKAFCEIDAKLLETADYVCHSRRGENIPAKPSSIVKIDTNGAFKIIRS